MKKFMIGIPSYKRAQHLMNRVNTLDHMEPWELEKTSLFVREEELDEYLPVAEKYGVGLKEIFLHEGDGMSETRDEILKDCYINEVEKCIMIDDDIDFAYKPTARKYITMTGSMRLYFRAMVNILLENCNEHIPLTGITARQFSQEKTTVFEDNTRIIQVFCIHLPTLQKENIWFSDCGTRTMSDYYFVLNLLTRGYPNRCFNRWTRDDIAQAPGGCETYRTVTMQSQSALKLARSFPTIVIPYWKEKGTWGKRHINVRIAWKKAYKQGVAKYGEQK